jgi:hypothetical protein
MNYNYETDSELEEDVSNIDFDPEEISITRFNIALCELFNAKLYGEDNSEVKFHFMIISRYKILNMEYIRNDAYYNFHKYLNTCIQHEIFPNYRKILTSKMFLKPQIVECIDLESGHRVAIIKTFWIKIIQRTWKTIFKKRKIIIQKRKNILSLHNRELTGNWPNTCYTLPSIKGMLNYLKTSSSSS